MKNKQTVLWAFWDDFGQLTNSKQNTFLIGIKTKARIVKANYKLKMDNFEQPTHQLLFTWKPHGIPIHPAKV